MPTRRTVIRTAAWSAPGVSLVAAAPAVAVTGLHLSLQGWGATRDDFTSSVRISFSGDVVNTGTLPLTSISWSLRVRPLIDTEAAAGEFAIRGNNDGFVTDGDGDLVVTDTVGQDGLGWYRQFTLTVDPTTLPGGEQVSLTFGLRLDAGSGYVLAPEPDGSTPYLGGSATISAVSGAATADTAATWVAGALPPPD